MNKIYDKLLLALAVLILLAGIGFYLMKSSAMPSAQLQFGQPEDFPYDVIPVRQPPEIVATWPEVTEQAPGELYDVFTPPKIYIDDDGTFKFKPPYSDDVEAKQPIGVYLADLADPQINHHQTNKLTHLNGLTGQTLVLFDNVESILNFLELFLCHRCQLR